MAQITAADLQVGDIFTYHIHEYTVLATRTDDEGNVWITYDGGAGYEMGFYADSPVLLLGRRPAPTPAETEGYAASRAQAREIGRELDKCKQYGQLTDEGQALIIFDRVGTDGKTRRVHQEYVTRGGFLKALYRMYNQPATFTVVAAEEGGWVPKGTY
jgi:hypothetical protein